MLHGKDHILPAPNPEGLTSTGAHDLYRIREETPSEASGGQLNPGYSFSLLNASFSSNLGGPGGGRLTPALSQLSVNSHASSLSSHCVISRPDGSTVLVTPDREANRTVPSKPLTQRKVNILRVVSVIAVFVFPPTGVAALMCSILMHRHYQTNKYSSMTDLISAKRYAKYCEILNIVTLICGLLMYTLIFTIISLTAGKSDSNDVGVV